MYELPQHIDSKGRNSYVPRPRCRDGVDAMTCAACAEAWRRISIRGK